MSEKLIVRDWQKIRAWLEPRIQRGQVRLISLDIFDTLLARCVEPPEIVQHAVCRKVGHSIGIAPAIVWQARQEAEQELRSEAVAAGFDHECRYVDLAPRWMDKLFREHDLSLGRFMCQTELSLEDASLHVKPEARVFMDWVREQGVKMVAVSDMYLNGDLMAELLGRKGLLHYFDQVFVSADYQEGKYTGKLFRRMLQQQAQQAAQVVHIGDNPVSDRRMACREGIQGVWLYEKKELRRRERLALSHRMAQRGSIWVGRHFFEAVQTRIHQDDSLNPRNFFFRYGRDVLGPAFSVFMQGLQERLQQQAKNGQAVEKLLFVARDGFLFERMYRELDEQLPSEYVYLSRKVITAAAVAKGLTHEQAIVAFYNPKQHGLESVCKVYGLPQEKLQPLAKEYGFNDFAEPIHDWQDVRLHNFLRDHQVQAIIRRVGQKHRDLLQRYLEQVGFFAHKRVALVDIGWNGTVQKFLKQAFGERNDFPALHGYYFAFVPKLYADFGDNNVCEGIVHDSRRGNACERIPAEFEEIFEQGARSHEATTIGYRECEGRIEPVLKPDSAPDRQAELRCNASVARMQEGIRCHWEHFRAVQQLTGYASQQLLPYVHGVLERAVVYPTREETRELTRLVHTEDFGHDHVLELGNQALGLRDLLRPRGLVQKLELSAWRYALFDGIPTGVANFAFRMMYLHTVKK
ncbi:MAG: HAD hydrolase-like protein [Gammaproteobacteria bacterium]|nr:HAD hydrolase-like protein [Gammaproteobacteria bacterium]MBU1722381.1 HAD hydrolase-like protein [Gammaproteobacteria bacterium]MBU2004682.1 HAD hydrolase-like protein [Gammaproteobacteria bacterium]